jgi:hypothetical protein
MSPSVSKIPAFSLGPKSRIVPQEAALAAGSAAFRVLLLLAGIALVVLVWLLASRASRTNVPTASRVLGDLRGEPINQAAGASPATAIAAKEVPSQATAAELTSVRRRHPKPASFPHRMVEFQVSQAERTNAQTSAGFGGSPAKVIFSPAQLAALSGPPLPPGCEDLSFTKLSDFPFDVTREMAEGSENLAAASAATRAKIPEPVQALDNHFVAIQGFLLPLRMNNGLTIEFLLLRNQKMCCFGSVPKVNEWICVQPEGEGVKPIMDQPITVLGRLRVGEIRENGYLVGIYRMEGAQVYMPAETKL